MTNAVSVPVQNEISHLSGPRGVTEKIKQAMYNAAREFVYIGFLLYEVKEYGYYREGGYQDVYDYAAQELGFKKSSVKNFIAITETFGQRTVKSNGCTSQIYTMSLQQPYEKFNYSQLCEMLSMSEKQRQQATPDMTVKQLRVLKKTPPVEHVEQPMTIEDLEDGQTSGQELNPFKSYLVNNYWRELDPQVVKILVQASGIRWNPKSCYDIVIKLHQD